MLAEMLIDKEGIPRGDNLYVLTNEQGVNQLVGLSDNFSCV